LKMPSEYENEIKRLKRDYFELEKTLIHEREALANVINTYGVVVQKYPDLAKSVKAIKELISNTDDELATDLIDKEVKELKGKIFSKELEPVSHEELERANQTKEALIEACRLIRRIIIGVAEDFYPLDVALEQKASAVDIDCSQELDRTKLKAAGEQFFDFLGDLRKKIEEDFQYINKTFLTLLDHVKGLEKTLVREFGSDELINEIEYFEMKISNEVGGIAKSFDIYTTIDEIKAAVIEKINKIKEAVSLRKKEELRRAKAAQNNIKKLRERINQAERQAKEMARRAEEFQTVAMKDGLTGLFNRQAFEVRMKNALARYKDEKEPFCLIMFDVDGFKKINDTFGHVAGDKVLKKVAECLKASFRESDFVARYGGDEFAVLIERMTPEMAYKRIEAFRRNLAKIKFVSKKKGEIVLGVSAGVAQVEEGDTRDTLVARADSLMYAEKQQRRQGAAKS